MSDNSVYGNKGGHPYIKRKLKAAYSLFSAFVMVINAVVRNHNIDILESMWYKLSLLLKLFADKGI